MSLELPLLIIDIQRGGPSTGLPTKTEQSDLLHAMFGRHGEAPVPIVAAMSPSHCFYAAIESVRIALKYRTPVFLLSDGYLANGSEPWRLPDVESLPDISVPFATEPNLDGEFMPYLRDPETLARPWAIPGTAGLEHRIGGLEKADVTGNISYDPDNHELMTRLRAAKVAGIDRGHPSGRGRCRRGCRGARAGLGLHLRLDRGGGAAHPGARAEGRPGPPRAPQPVPAATSARSSAATTRCSCPR